MAWTPISPWKLIEGSAQVVAIGASASSSVTFGGQTRAILISATADCHIRIGRSPVAVSTDTLVKAAWPPILVGCGPGDQLSVIQDAGGGSLSITELTH